MQTLYNYNTETPQAGLLNKRAKPSEESFSLKQRNKDRYVWTAFKDIDLSTWNHMNQPMSVSYIHRGRIALITPTFYIALDQSLESFESPGESDEVPMKEFTLTADAQWLYLESNYAETGLVDLNQLKGLSENIVSQIEQILLPEVPPNLIQLYQYLSTTSKSNLEQANLDSKTLKLAEDTLASFIDATRKSIGYAERVLGESKAEILSRKSGKPGKSEWDSRDRYCFFLLDRELPDTATLAEADSRTEKLFERLVDTLDNKLGSAPQIIQVQQPPADNSEVESLKKQLADMQDKFEQLADKLSIQEESKSKSKK
jgi:hypothetical protein